MKQVNDITELHIYHSHFSVSFSLFSTFVWQRPVSSACVSALPSFLWLTDPTSPVGGILWRTWASPSGSIGHRRTWLQAGPHQVCSGDHIRTWFVDCSWFYVRMDDNRTCPCDQPEEFGRSPELRDRGNKLKNKNEFCLNKCFY